MSRNPSIPDPPRGASPAMRRWMAKAKEAMEVALGRRGDQRDAAVTYDDLFKAGIVESLGRVDPRTGRPGIRLPDLYVPDPTDNPGQPTDPYGPPPTPAGLHAAGVFGGVHLIWNREADRPDILLVEIWRGETDQLSQATLLNAVNASSYFDRIEDSETPPTYYYWVRFLILSEQYSPWVGPVSATPQRSVAYVLEDLEGALDANDFEQALRERIGLIDAPDTSAGSVNARISDAQDTLEDADTALTQQVTTYQAGIDSAYATVRSTLNTESNRLDGRLTTTANSVNGVQTSIDGQLVAVEQAINTWVSEGEDDLAGLGAQASLLLDVDGYVSGYTTYNDGDTAGFSILTDALAVGGGGNSVYPFIVTGGVSHFNAAMIREASIEQGKLGPISFGKIVDGNGNPVTTVGGLLRGELVDFSGFRATTANIANGAVTTAKIADTAADTARIVDGAANTVKIRGQAVNQPVFAEGGSGSFLVDQGGYIATSVSFTSTGAPLYLSGTVAYEISSYPLPGQTGASYRLRVASQLQGGQGWQTQVTTNRTLMIAIQKAEGVLNASAGAVTAQVAVELVTASGQLLAFGDVEFATLYCCEVKR